MYPIFVESVFFVFLKTVYCKVKILILDFESYSSNFAVVRSSKNAPTLTNTYYNVSLLYSVSLPLTKDSPVCILPSVVRQTDVLFATKPNLKPIIYLKVYFLI